MVTKAAMQSQRVSQAKGFVVLKLSMRAAILSEDLTRLPQKPSLRKFQFKIMSTAPEVQNAVQAQLMRLRARFPAWEFSVIFGP